jgi:MFS family permease
MGRPPVTQALVIEGFLSRLSFGLLTFALPLYGRELGLSIVQIGLLSSLAQTVSLVLKPVMGGFADRWGLRRSLVGALVIRSLLCLSYALTTVPWQLYSVRGAHGVSDSLRDPAVHALIAENGGKKSMASAFAWYQTAKTAAGSVGKSVAGVLLAMAGGFGLTFGVAFALSLLPVIAVLWLVPRDARSTRPDPVPPARPVPEKAAPPAPLSTDGRRAAGSPPGVVAFAGLGFLVAGTSSMLTSLFPIIATEYAGLSTAEAGLLYLVTPALALTGPFWGWLADRVSRPAVLSFRSIANVLSALAYLVSPTLAGVWVGKSLDDLGKAAFRPAWGSLMAEVSGRDRKHRARVMGFLTSGEDAGDIVAPVLAGLLWSVWGVPALLVGRMLVAGVTEVYAIGIERRQRNAARAMDHRPQVVTEIREGLGGRWLVRSGSSRHVWDLDARTYMRMPSPASQPFDHDGVPHRITTVEWWPRLGQRSFVWVDVPDAPAGREHYRVSSPIRSIERLPAGSHS